MPNLYYNTEQLAVDLGYEVTSLSVNLPKKEDKKNSSTTIVETEVNTALEDLNNTLIDGEVASGLTIKTRKVKEIDITLSLEGGGYSNLKNLLDSIEHNLKIFDIQNLTYDPSDTTMSFQMKTYYYE